jgi:hypothetical protein
MSSKLDKLALKANKAIEAAEAAQTAATSAEETAAETKDILGRHDNKQTELLSKTCQKLEQQSTRIRDAVKEAS